MMGLPPRGPGVEERANREIQLLKHQSSRMTELRKVNGQGRFERWKHSNPRLVVWVFKPSLISDALGWYFIASTYHPHQKHCQI
jgi:hypothetical protein